MTQITAAKPEASQPFSVPMGQDIPTPRLDGQGNHLQLYGEPAPHDGLSTLRRLGVPPDLKVASRREKARNEGRPQVVLFCHDGPWHLDFRLSPDEARALAVNLVDAAEACDALSRRLSADSKPRKATATA